MNLDSSPRARAALATAPPFLYALLLLALPLVAIVVVSFWSESAGDFDTTPTVENYREVLTRPIYIWGNAANWGTVPMSLFVAATVTALTVALGFPIAYFISFHAEPSRKPLWLFLITIPFWTSYLIRIFLWRAILGQTGVVNTALQSVGIIDEPLGFLLYNVGAVIAALAHTYVVFAILPIYVALEKIDRSLLEAAQDLGENRLMTFLRVTLPLAVPGIVGAVLIVFIPVVGDYVTPEFLYGAGGRLVSNVIQADFLQNGNWPRGSAAAIVTMALVGAIAVSFVLLTTRWTRGPR